MKKCITLTLGLVLITLLTSCSSKKKAVKANMQQLDSIAVGKVMTEKVEKIVDTTRIEHGKVTITEIAFYSPAQIAPGEATANITLNNVGKMQGVVKSIRQTVIQSDVQKKGESKKSCESDNSENSAILSKQEKTMDEQHEPTLDPYRWRYIFYIGLSIVALLIYLKRVPILNWIKKILFGLLKIF